MGLSFIAIGAFSLGFALISEHFFGLRPCGLCIYQRWPYAIVIGIGLSMVILNHKTPRFCAFLSLFASVIFLTGMVIAAFHTGVEQGWWKGLESCTLSADLMKASLDELEALINAAPVVRCDEIPWQLFGLSMAAYNTFLSFGYALFALLGAIMITRKNNGF
jgi:disulfide bond formation protein DsbB